MLRSQRRFSDTFIDSANRITLSIMQQYVLARGSKPSSLSITIFAAILDLNVELSNDSQYTETLLSLSPKRVQGGTFAVPPYALHFRHHRHSSTETTM